MGRVKLGVIGAGRIGEVHIGNIGRFIPEASVEVLSDVMLARARTVARRFAIADVTSNPEQVFSDPGIDAVLICSSTDTHAAFIEAAARGGKHIFCEKPIALDLASIDRALAVVEDTGVRLQIGFNRRFDPNFAEVHRLVAEGAIGRPQILRISSRDPEPPPIEYVKVSGGLFVDMTIHDFDMARFIMGEEVEEVYATGAALIDPKIGEAGDIDTAMVTLRFRSGAIGAIDNSRQAVYGYDQRLEVFGEKGKIIADNPKPHTAVQSSRDGDHAPPLLHFFLERYSVSFSNEVRAFIDAIQNETAPPVTGMDGRIPVVMALAAQRSLIEGRPVGLSEVDAAP